MKTTWILILATTLFICDLTVMGSKSKFPASADYPDLSKRKNWMSKSMTPEVYEKLRDKITPSGFTLDHCIRTGELQRGL